MRNRFKTLFLFSTFLLSFVAFADVNAQNKNVRIVDFETFETLLHKKNDTVYVINFWATWCVPCMKELPEFEKLNENYADENFKMILVSLDFKSTIESQLMPFIAKKDIRTDVLLLHEPDANAWIDKVDQSWTGAIPATVIYKNNFRKFHEGSYTYSELEQIIKPLLKQ